MGKRPSWMKITATCLRFCYFTTSTNRKFLFNWKIKKNMHVCKYRSAEGQFFVASSRVWKICFPHVLGITFFSTSLCFAQIFETVFYSNIFRDVYMYGSIIISGLGLANAKTSKHEANLMELHANKVHRPECFTSPFINLRSHISSSKLQFVR